ncbi:MAG: hypothetical protein JWR19_2056 [Pedosphaera sp.]|jgi:hypothetical protein|nr:hypothetical protein [Pedosphaera sp.]
MLTVACTLTYSDGQEVTGRIEARSPGVNYPITCTGSVDRLGTKCDTGTASDLELLFTLAARRTGAKFDISRTGQYERRHLGVLALL